MSMEQMPFENGTEGIQPDIAHPAREGAAKPSGTSLYVVKVITP